MKEVERRRLSIRETLARVDKLDLDSRVLLWTVCHELPSVSEATKSDGIFVAGRVIVVAIDLALAALRPKY